MDFTIKIDGLQLLIDAMTAAGANVKPLIAMAIRASLLKVQSETRQRAPHRTGTLQRSILPEFHDLFGEVKVNEKYGLWLEEGTGPYEIRPRNKKALMWPGALHPVKVVHHPGLKARPFFQPGIEASQSFIREQFIAVEQTLARNIAARRTA